MRQRFLAGLTDLDLPRGTRVLVAVSGGADSVALLDLLVATGETHRLELSVGHVDHGISSESAAVASRVEQLARSYGLRCFTAHLALGASASETVAREARYRSLEETRQRDSASWIITAHHADDQVETVFLRFLSGSGPAGLSGMQPARDRILRPLLGFRREELQHYVQGRGLTWWEDPANGNPRHLRSWLRSKVLPLVRERIPAVEESLLAVASQASTDRLAWDRIIELLPGLDWSLENSGGSVAVAPFAGYDSTVGRAVLRALGRRVGCVLSRDHAARMYAFLDRPESGSRLEVGNGWTLEIVFDRAHLRPANLEGPALASTGDFLVEGEAGDGELGRWRVYWRHEKAPPVQERDGLTAWFIPQALRIRRWTAGDRVFPLGGRGHRLVVRCFQDARVPRQQRQEWPVIAEAAGEIVWIPGVCRSNRLVPRAGAEALRVDAQVV